MNILSPLLPSPYELLSACVPIKGGLATIQTPDPSLVDSRNDRATNLQTLREAYVKVKDALALAFQRNAAHFNVGRNSVRFRLGDVVWRRNFARSNPVDQGGGKFAPRYVRCRVSRGISPQVYELTDMDSPYSCNYHVKDILK